MSKTDKILKREGYGIPYLQNSFNFRPENALSAKAGIEILACGSISKLIDWNYRDVFSPFWRLYYNPTAGAGVQCDDTYYPLRPQSILIIPDHLTFNCQCNADREVSHLWIHFSPSVCYSTQYRQPFYIPLNACLDELTTQLYSKLNIQATNNTPPASANLLTLHHLCLALLNRIFADLSLSEAPQWAENFSELIDYCRHNAHTIETLEELAQDYGMSARTLRRRFREHLNLSPHEFVLRCRLHLAAELLRGSSKSIEYIATECGFSDRNHFSKSFKSQIGISPAAFRKTNG